MVMLGILAGLFVASVALQGWQWWVGRRFLRARSNGEVPGPASSAQGSRGVTLLKPVGDVTRETAACLRSWLDQERDGPIQVVWGIDPGREGSVDLVHALMAEHPVGDMVVVDCGRDAAANPKIAKLLQMASAARYDDVVVSDSDVWAPPGLVKELMRLVDRRGVGLACCLYRLAGRSSWKTAWETVAVNVDFWTQVLQARSIGPMGFALGAVMAFRREWLERAGGWSALKDQLADDYHLGRRVRAAGGEVVLAGTVVECRGGGGSWSETWEHQLRWARTIRSCRPLGYAGSLLSVSLLWGMLWLVGTAASGAPRLGWVLGGVSFGLWIRVTMARDLQRRFGVEEGLRPRGWVVLLKDGLQVVLWIRAWVGSRVTWAGETFRVGRGGRAMRIG